MPPVLLPGFTRWEINYAIVPKTTPKATSIGKLVLYAMSDGQKYGPALDFASIPQVVLNAAKNTLKQVKQG